MTEYVKSTNFASKDSLATGNPLKIVKGTEIDTEFNNIATAVATKADLNSPALIGTPTAPTASAGTNTTQVATTAFVSTAVTNERSATATLTNKTLTSPTISSPTISDAVLTGTPTAPTASANTSTTQVATTAFVNTSIATLTNKTINLSNNTISGTKAQFDTACSDADFASLAGTETLTNKTVNLSNNTLTGTKAQFNTSCSDTDFSFLNDFTGSNQSLGSSSGYQKLPGGLTIQWATASFTGDTSDGSVSATFPTSFASACVIVIPVVQASVAYSGVISVYTHSISTSGVTFKIDNSTSLSETVDIKYLAIGY